MEQASEQIDQREAKILQASVLIIFLTAVAWSQEVEPTSHLFQSQLALASSLGYPKTRSDSLGIEWWGREAFKFAVAGGYAARPGNDGAGNSARGRFATPGGGSEWQGGRPSRIYCNPNNLRRIADFGRIPADTVKRHIYTVKPEWQS